MHHNSFLCWGKLLYKSQVSVWRFICWLYIYFSFYFHPLKGIWCLCFDVLLEKFYSTFFYFNASPLFKAYIPVSLQPQKRTKKITHMKSGRPASAAEVVSFLKWLSVAFSYQISCGLGLPGVAAAEVGFG